MANHLSEPLMDAELDRLDDILRGRFPTDAQENSDNVFGINDISMLDGFFTAIISSKKLILPGEWWPWVWGDYEPSWKTLEEAEEILTLMTRHMNHLIHLLTESIEDYGLLCLEVPESEKSHMTVVSWCIGYVQGVQLELDYWEELPEELKFHLDQIFLFGSEDTFEQDLNRLSDEEVQRLMKLLPDRVCILHAHGLWERRARPDQVRRDSPKVGRNDPCPCGSGRKFKKCCEEKTSTIH